MRTSARCSWPPARARLGDTPVRSAAASTAGRARSCATSSTSMPSEEPPAPDAPPIRGARWSEPRQVIRAEFTEWTTDGLLRQASFKGREMGRDPRTVLSRAGRAGRSAARASGRQPASLGTAAPATIPPDRACHGRPMDAAASLRVRVVAGRVARIGRATWPRIAADARADRAGLEHAGRPP